MMMTTGHTGNLYHNKKDYRVTIIFIWLFVVTIISLCGIFRTDKEEIKVQKIYDLPPIEVLEVDLEGGDYHGD